MTRNQALKKIAKLFPSGFDLRPDIIDDDVEEIWFEEVDEILPSGKVVMVNCVSRIMKLHHDGNGNYELRPTGKAGNP